MYVFSHCRVYVRVLQCLINLRYSYVLLGLHWAYSLNNRDIQILKGCMRETETDRVWACSRMPMNRLHHLRSK